MRDPALSYEIVLLRLYFNFKICKSENNVTEQKCCFDNQMNIYVKIKL